MKNTSTHTGTTGRRFRTRLGIAVVGVLAGVAAFGPSANAGAANQTTTAKAPECYKYTPNRRIIGQANIYPQAGRASQWIRYRIWYKVESYSSVWQWHQSEWSPWALATTTRPAPATATVSETDLWNAAPNLLPTWSTYNEVAWYVGNNLQVSGGSYPEVYVQDGLNQSRFCWA